MIAVSIFIYSFLFFIVRLCVLFFVSEILGTVRKNYNNGRQRIKRGLGKLARFSGSTIHLFSKK